MSEDVFARISQAALKLNLRADAVSLRVRDAEEQLEKAGAGFEVEDSTFFHMKDTTYKSGDMEGDEPEVTHFAEIGSDLLYMRYGSKWRICVRTATYSNGGDGKPVVEPEITPLLDCDRQTRIRAFDRLPLFLEEIAKQLEETVTKLNAPK